jgi:hypothetical protein
MLLLDSSAKGTCSCISIETQNFVVVVVVVVVVDSYM